MTRQQVSKVTVLSAGWSINTAGGPHFTDVPITTSLYIYIETAYNHDLIRGYNCGQEGEPCDSQNRPYFRPTNNVTRQQLCKFVVVAKIWPINTTGGPHFTDVPVTTTLYSYVETAYNHDVISGYDCEAPGEPCDPQNRPYFRPTDDISRGQVSKMEALTFFPDCTPACLSSGDVTDTKRASPTPTPRGNKRGRSSAPQPRPSRQPRLPLPVNTPWPILTDTPTFPPTGTPAPCGPGSNYTVTRTLGSSMAPGTELVEGSQCDECATTIPLPFPVQFYGQSYSNIILGSNGTLGFRSNDNDFGNLCIPVPSTNYAVLPYWDDLDMRTSVRSDLGIFTSISGNAPERVFNIEWRACIYDTGLCGGNTNFEVRFSEVEDRFEFVYGDVSRYGGSATIGVQRGDSLYTPYTCNLTSVYPGVRLIFMPTSCNPANTPTSTRTYTPLNQPTNTPTSTRTNTPTRTATGTATTTGVPIIGHYFVPGLDAPPYGGTVAVGQGFYLVLHVDGGDGLTTAQQAYLTFDSALLQNVNATNPASCTLASTVTPDLFAFDAPIQNEVCNGPNPCVFRGITVPAGSMAYVSGALNTCPGGCIGDFPVAQIAFCAIAPGEATVHWQFSPPDPQTRDTEVLDENSQRVEMRLQYRDYTITIVGSIPTTTPTPILTSTFTNTPTNTRTRTYTRTPTYTNTPPLRRRLRPLCL